MKIEKQGKSFLTNLMIFVVPIFLMFAAFSTVYDGLHPLSAFQAVGLAAILTFGYGIVISYLKVKKRIKNF